MVALEFGQDGLLVSVKASGTGGVVDASDCGLDKPGFVMHNLESRRHPETNAQVPADSKYGRIVEFAEVAGRSSGNNNEAIARRNYKTLWTYAANCILGLWLITSPAVFDYQSVGLSTSDTVCGALVICFEIVLCSFRDSQWGDGLQQP